MIEYWSWIESTFNNREIATGFWFVVLAAWLLPKRKVRSSVWGLIRALFHRKLVLLFGSISVNLMILCWILWKLGLWKSDQLSSTFFWFLLSGIALAGNAVNAKENAYFKTAILHSLRVTAAFEFVVVAYSFGLLTELILVPILAVVAGMAAYAEIKTEYANVRAVLQLISLTMVSAFLWKSVGEIWSQPESFFSYKTGREFILPALLTAGSIPLMYFWYCYSNFETACVRINLKTFQSDDLKRYARRRFLLSFVARPAKLHQAVKTLHSKPAMDNSDVDHIINELSRRPK